VLRKIYGPKRDEDGSWRKLHNDELYSRYSSSNNVRVIRGRLDTRHERGRGVVFIGFWLGSPKSRDHWEDLGIGGRITIKRTFGR
jgi:hypothetical protein